MTLREDAEQCGDQLTVQRVAAATGRGVGDIAVAEIVLRVGEGEGSGGTLMPERRSAGEPCGAVEHEPVAGRERHNQVVARHLYLRDRLDRLLAEQRRAR